MIHLTNAFPAPLIALAALLTTAAAHAERPPAPVVDTGQVLCFDTFEPIQPPKAGSRFYGQDAQYAGLQASYRDNGDGTVTDLNTGLTWSQATDTKKVSLAEAEAIAAEMTLGGHHDWRVPNIKELYSLIDFRGVTGLMSHGGYNTAPKNAVPYINTDYFDFRYGDTEHGERFIDGQWLTTTVNVSPVFGRQKGLFGVNFADGRIKCYPFTNKRRNGDKLFYARYVRGRTDYGINDFVDNGDGTVTDRATGLTWMQADSGQGMDWEDALHYAEQLQLGGHSDWRLPNAKELQSIVDYSRSPDATDSPALDPIFSTTQIKNEAGEADYPFFWTGTTHLDGPNAGQAVYIAFGRGIGQMHGAVLDVHGAGCQRSDPKEGEARLGHGPQGDAQRVLNYVRCVRGGAIASNAATDSAKDSYPNYVRLPAGGSMRYQEAPTQPENMDPGAPRGMGPPPPRPW